jgi:hypothetical protein
LVTATRHANSQIVRKARRPVWAGRVRVERGAWVAVEDLRESRMMRPMKMEDTIARRRQPTCGERVG